MSVTATIETTGEVVDFPAETPEEVLESFRLVNEHIDAYKKLKEELQARATQIVDARGTFEHGGYMLRVYTTQRMNYDKGVLREVLDADELDLMLEPVKGRIDNYIREHLEDLGELSTKLRETMVPSGRPYQVVRLERTEAAS